MATRSLKTLLLLGALILMILTSAQPRPGEASTPAASTAPSIWVTPLVLDFGPVGVGETSETLSVWIMNTGNAILENFAGGGVGSPFHGSQNCAGGVGPGMFCQYFFYFSPTEVGFFSDISNSSTNAGPFSIELRGEGVGAGLHVTPLSLDFGTLHVGNAAPTQIVKIRNTGLSTLTNFAGGAVDAPFDAAQNCAGGVAPGESCQYFFYFEPTVAGFYTDTSNSGTNAGPFSIDLMGRGWEDLYVFTQRVTPRSLDFGPVGVDFIGETQVVTITNQSPEGITGWAGGGVNSPFGAAQNCAGGLPPGDSCQFYYTFNPTETGVFTTTSNVANSLGSFTIELRGEGVGAGLSASPLNLDFGPVPPGYDGSMQVVYVKNTGLATLAGFAGGGVHAPFEASQDCAAGVPPGGTCHFFYNFSPTEWGHFSTTSSVASNGGSFMVHLSGGMELPVMEMSFLPDRIDPGGTTTLRYTIHNLNLNSTFFSVAFTNDFPAGLSIASPLVYSVSSECGDPTFNPTAGATTLSFSDGTILGGKDCVVEVVVTAANRGIYGTSTSPVSTTTGNGIPAGDTLYVGDYSFMPIIRK